jgi:hypothetical protein
VQWDATGFTVPYEAEAHAKSIVFGLNTSANAHRQSFIVKGRRQVKLNATIRSS